MRKFRYRTPNCHLLDLSCWSATGSTGGMKEDSGDPAHRADYVLDRGVWRATCRVCGLKLSDADRRQVASQFRQHIRDQAAISPARREPVIDLRTRNTERVTSASEQAAPGRNQEVG